MKHIQILFFILTFFSVETSGQIQVNLTIENEVIDETNYLFDIYLTRAPGSTGDIFLANADLIITYYQQIFSNPGLTLERNPSYCTFTPGVPSDLNNPLTQAIYLNNTAVDMDNSQIMINLNGPTPGSELGFLSSVAKIDTLPSTHRLGRFRISGVIDPEADANLQWKTDGSGLKTMVFSMNPQPPFNSFQIEIETLNTCPDSLEVDGNPINSGLYQAASQLSALGQILTSANITFSAGQDVILHPEFEIALGSTLLIRIQGCE